MIGRIVMIDAYVDVHHSIFYKSKVKNLELVDKKWIVTDRDTEINPHGTAIAGILSQTVPDDIEIINFDIYDTDNDKQFGNLLSALEFVYNCIECDIINMSLGTRLHDERLFDICKKLHTKGIFIVSAFDNAGAISYPAAYDFVIGVDVSPKVKKKYEYVWVENSLVNIRGMGGLQRVAWADGLYTINQGSSFAAPHITGIIMKHIYQKVPNVLDVLKENAVYIYENRNEEVKDKRCLTNIRKKVALFPYNKEMHALVNYPELLNFELVKVFDCKYSNCLGKSVGRNAHYVVEDIRECEWNNFDTLIIGHLSELELLTKSELKVGILKQCLENNINVYLYDDIGIDFEIINKFEKKNLDIVIQSTSYKKIHNKFGKLFTIESPVLGVFGTSKRQGKYTLQLMLRKKLTEKGYRVGELGTEPNSLLFGMDASYPIGYNGINNRNVYEIVEDTNDLLHEIDLKNPDLIIVGSQSGTTPLGFNNVAQITLMQCAFLIGTNPDAIILNVNFDDSIEYIVRTIKAIEGLGRGKVISIVIYPCAYQNGWGIIRDVKRKINQEDILETKRKSIESNLRIRTFILGDETQENMLLDNCIDFFCGGVLWKI